MSKRPLNYSTGSDKHTFVPIDIVDRIKTIPSSRNRNIPPGWDDKDKSSRSMVSSYKGKHIRVDLSSALKARINVNKIARKQGFIDFDERRVFTAALLTVTDMLSSKYTLEITERLTKIAKEYFGGQHNSAPHGSRLYELVNLYNQSCRTPEK